jgi:hypothetical protein
MIARGCCRHDARRDGNCGTPTAPPGAPPQLTPRSATAPPLRIEGGAVVRDQELDTRINAQFSRGVRLTGVAVPGAAAYPAASA